MDNYDLGQIKDIKSVKKTDYKYLTIPIPIKDKPGIRAKESLEIVLFKYYRNYYLNEVLYGQILSNDNQHWFPRKNYGNKNYLISTKKAGDKGTIPEVAILRDLHNHQLTMLWNFYNFFEDREVRHYEYFFDNEEF